MKNKTLNQSKNCVTAKVIKEQFIERDLFNATDISQIKWRIYGQNFTKQHFEKFLKENKEAIKKLGERKIKNLFPPAQRSTINESNFVDEMIDNLKNNYDKIFIKK